MGKKHREKRQKYIDLLRKTEKEREAYLEKRNKKRNRSEDEEVAEGDRHAFCGQSHKADEDESTLKKRRTEVDPSASKKSNPPSDESAAAKKDTKSKKY